MVLTSHDELGISGNKTGFWLEALAAPYYVFKDAGAEITLASPKGGLPPLDPKSAENDMQTASTKRFRGDKEAEAALATTSILGDILPADYDALFYPGGQGLLWDLAEDKDSISLIETMYAQGKPVSAVCHAPGVFRHARSPDGSPLVKGKSVTGLSNSQETVVGLADTVPFLVENELEKCGGNYSEVDDWKSYFVIDGNLITGQNPASAVAVAKAVLGQLG
jgi:putative intracellular protease/amidase